MARLLTPILALVLVFFRGGHSWNAPQVCRHSPCPSYQPMDDEDAHKKYEKRLYDSTTWISTKINGTSVVDFLKANSRLKAFCKTLDGEVCETISSAWPVLVSLTKNAELWLSWFVPQTGTLQLHSLGQVKVKTRPKSIVYVRIFNGQPSVEAGESHADALWKDLDRGCAERPPFDGAGYSPYISLQHHNEIWMYEDDICKTAE